MEVKKVLSVGKRLQIILEEAEKESQQKLGDARRHSEELVNKAKADAEEKKSKAQRGVGIDDLVNSEEIRAKKEAEKIKAQYQQKIEAIKKFSKSKKDQSVDRVIREVLP